MNAVTVDLMCRCQATRRRRDVESGLGWWRGRQILRCCERPFHTGPHTYERPTA